MHLSTHQIQLISAPTILGLKPSGVELLSESLLGSGLAEKLHSSLPLINVPTLNHLYSNIRDKKTNCLNTDAILDFSLQLGKVVLNTIEKKCFAFVLGGDCSILIGIMSALKSTGDYGLIFLDAHADFYEPEKSTSGEAADMDLALITGRGPEIWTNINNLRPYLKDVNVVHVGQRDWEETRKYGSQDILETGIKCYNLAAIESSGIDFIVKEVITYIEPLQIKGFWMHFDTDVLSDQLNPAVDYRLPGGLQFKEVEHLIKSLLATGKIAGISVSIFNPKLDASGLISKNISESLGRAFYMNNH